jgi:hypothetical protein
MNSWVILQHFKIGSDVFTEERCFDEIVDFTYCTDFGGGYLLKAIRKDEYTEEEIPVSYTIGRFERDYIYYNGNKFYTEDFPMLVKMIHNRNIKRDLEVLE